MSKPIKTNTVVKVVKKIIGRLDQIPETIFYVDTGYSKPESIQILNKIYAAKQLDLSKQMFCILLCKRVKNSELSKGPKTYPELTFSRNWNNKLECNAFTTIRLNQDKWKEGGMYNLKKPID